MSDGQTMNEMKSALIEAIDYTSQNVTDDVAYCLFLEGKLFPKKMLKERIRETLNPDFLENAANILIDAGIYYENEKFHFPEEETT